MSGAQTPDGLSTHGLALLANGYQPVPIPRGFKYPASVNGWQTLKADTAMIEAWTANGHAEAGVGILCGRVVALDFDLRDEGIKTHMVAFTRNRLGYAPERIGNAPKTMLVFRTDEPFTKMSSRKFVDMFDDEHQIEALCDGQQFVAHAIHPETGEPYHWPERDLTEIPVNELTLITQDDLQAIFDELEAIAPTDWVPVTYSRKAVASKRLTPLEAAKPRSNLDEAQITRCLELIVDRVDYRDDWIKVGMALHHQYGGGHDGLELWEAWSQEGVKFKEGECEQKWAGFGRDLTREPVTFATVVKWASDAHLKDAKPKFKQGPLMTLAELKSKLGPINWLIDGIIEADSLSLMYGAPASYKSFLSIDWACCVATGNPWKGRAVKQGPVIYVAGEGHNGLARRVTAWEKDNVSLKDAPIAFTRSAVAMLDLESAERTADAVAEAAVQIGEPVLIIIDTLARNFGPGDENSTSDMSQFIDTVSVYFRERFGANVMLVHHTGKSNQGVARGASALRAGMDQEFLLESYASIPGVLRLTNTKMKDAREPEDMFFKPRELNIDRTMEEAGKKKMTSMVLDLAEEPVRELKDQAKKVSAKSAPVVEPALAVKVSPTAALVFGEIRDAVVSRGDLQTVVTNLDIVTSDSGFRDALRKLREAGVAETFKDDDGHKMVRRTADRVSYERTVTVQGSSGFEKRKELSEVSHAPVTEGGSHA